MTARMISACVSTLVLGCGLLAPAPAHAQSGHVFTLTRHYDAAVTVSPNEMVHVTIVNPKPDPAATVGGNVEFEWKVEEGESSEGELGFTIEPGEARTFTLDPRAAGELLDGRSGLRRVVVSFALHAEVHEDVPAPVPSVAVELVNVRTGEARMALLLPAIQSVD